MAGDPETEQVSIPETSWETANWLRILAREINTFVLFLQTWSAMGFRINPEVASSLVELQSKIMEARSGLRGIAPERIPDEFRERLKIIASHEERVYSQLTEEIKRFKEESEGIFPAFKLNFDPCF